MSDDFHFKGQNELHLLIFSVLSLFSSFHGPRLLFCIAFHDRRESGGLFIMSDADEAAAIDGKVWVRLLSDERKDARADTPVSNQEQSDESTKKRSQKTKTRESATSFNVQLIE
jgi:hypothetical protein